MSPMDHTGNAYQRPIAAHELIHTWQQLMQRIFEIRVVSLRKNNNDI
jgi:hypothetical protein